MTATSLEVRRIIASATTVTPSRELARAVIDVARSYDSAPGGTAIQLVLEFRIAQSGQYTATLPVSKDSVIFGVRAVDATGHASLAVVPMPVR